MSEKITYLKKALKSDTIKWGLSLALLSAANAYFEANLPGEVYSLIGGIFSAAIIYVRTQTTGPINEK